MYVGVKQKKGPPCSSHAAADAAATFFTSTKVAALFLIIVPSTMPNINTLFSNRPKDDDEHSDGSEDDENARYVGGISSHGGGSGLAVLPDPHADRSAIFQRAEQDQHDDDEAGGQQGHRRIITMYRDGFTVDDGPYRRVDDPNNAEFLQSIARGMTPLELVNDAPPGGNITVVLSDKRSEDYVETFHSFSGVGQSLGSRGGSGSASSGVIDPSVGSLPIQTPATGGKVTSIQVRLLAGKRLVIKLPVNAPVQALVQEILGSGDAGSDPFVLMGGFPPRQITNLCVTIQEAGLAGASVTQKKA